MVTTQTPCINNTVLELAEGGINVGWCDLPTAP